MSRQQQVPPGYQRTEVGVLPDDWKVKRLKEIGVFSKGIGIRKNEVVADGLPCIRYGEIYTHHHDYIREFNSYIPPEVAQTGRRLRKGELLFAGSGETAEEIGKCVAFLGAEEAYAGSDIVILSPEEQDSLFLGYLLNQSVAVEQKSRRGQGDAVVHISARNLGEVRIPLPPAEEQRAIAGALADVDALLRAQDKLIAKKRAIKQATMQQLLTGRRRLPGYAGKWNSQSLEALEKVGGIRLFRGNVISKRNMENFPGDYPVYSSSVVSEGMFGKYGKYMFDEELITWSVDGGGDFFYRPRHKFSVTNVCGYMRVNGALMNCRFLAAQLQYLHSQKQFDYQLKAHPSVIRKAYILMLPEMREQTAIAEVLTDMDAEIAALEKQRDKTRALKQGMMQELLTGRIRLV